MKKTLIFLLAAVVAVLLAVPAFAATNSNHLIDQGYPSFNSDETEWEIFGWTCVDTPVTALGFRLDGGETEWRIDRVITRDDASKVRDDDCFEDLELERAIIEMSLQNGLDEFYGYRMHITLDTSQMTKGTHTFEFVVKYEDGTEGNPCRETVYEIEKHRKPKESVTTAEQTTEELTTEEQTTEELTTEEQTTDAPPVELTTEAQTAGEITTQAQTSPETQAETTGTNTKPGGNPAVIITVAVICAVAVAAVIAAIVIKKKKK